jgi:hypothetical protein
MFRILKKLGLGLAVFKAVKQWTRPWYPTSLRRSLLVLAFFALSLAGAATIGTAPPLWKIGRAVFEWRAPLVAALPQGQTPPAQPPPAQAIPVLKLSLRNEGGAGSLPVQIFGRWAAPAAPPQSFLLLGSYQQQVALTQTAIVEASLTALSKAPAGKLTLEISVTTGGKESDRKSIAWN